MLPAGTRAKRLETHIRRSWWDLRWFLASHQGVATIALGIVAATTGFILGSATLERLGAKFGTVGLLLAITDGAALVAPDLIRQVYG